MNQHEKVFEAMAANEMPDPFAEERAALSARPADELVSHEQARLNNLNEFQKGFKVAQVQYRAAALRSDWTTTGKIAGQVLQAAEAIK